MNKLIYIWFIGLLFLFVPVYAEDFVTIHVSTPGTLSLPDKALFASKLRITGEIDARDFKTLKRVTMNRTEVLDLSQANIHAYQGLSGCYAPKTSDWVGGGGESYHEYPANIFPIHAFSEIKDNSIYKWRDGSYSLKRLILPLSLKGFEDEAIYKTNTLCELEVPKGSEYLKSDDQVVYSIDGKRMLLAAPVRTRGIEVPSSVEKIDKNALAGMKFEYLGFNFATPPEIEDENFQVAYITVPDNHFYDDVLQNVDHVKHMSQIVLNDLEEGTLQETIKSKGYLLEDLRNLCITGSINGNDMQYLNTLPNLYYLDLSGAKVNLYNMYVTAKKLCQIKLPEGATTLTISADNYLSGHLDIPEGIIYFDGQKLGFDSVTFPSTIIELSSSVFYNSLVRSVDLSKCSALYSVEGFSSCYLLEEVKLPPYLKKMNSFRNAPIQEIEFPETVEELAGGVNWKVRSLTFPSSLKKISDFSEMTNLVEVDFSACKKLEFFNAFSCCPKLENLDLSMCPVTELLGLHGEYLPEGVVVSGRTHYPAPVASGLKNIRVPYTVQNLHAFYYCDSLRSLDLEECYQLEKIEGIHYCDVLEKVTLSPALTELDAFAECPSLREVTLAAQTPPQFVGDVEDTTIAHIRLFVPTGCVPAYTAHSYWSRSQDCENGGYAVHLVCDKGLNLPLSGSGLYIPGTEVKLHAPKNIYTDQMHVAEFRGWYDRINYEFLSDSSFMVKGHMSLKASYNPAEVDLRRADLFCELEVSEEMSVSMVVTTQYNRGSYLYLEGHQDGEFFTDNTTRILTLYPGKNRIGLVGEIVAWYLRNEEDNGKEVKVTQWTVAKPEALETMTVKNIAFPVSDYSELRNLRYLECINIGLDTLNVSENEKLSYLDCRDNQLRYLNLENNSHLDRLSCENNKLYQLRLPDHELSLLGISNNYFAFSSIPQSAYKALKNNYGGTTSIYIPFNIPEDFWINEYLLDLTSEQYDADTLAQTEVRFWNIIGGGEVEEVEPYIYQFSPASGYYNIYLTNPAMPDLVFQGYKEYLTTEIPKTEEDKMHIMVQDKTIILSSMESEKQVELFLADGRMVARGIVVKGGLRLRVPVSGIYFLRMKSVSGKNIVHKVLVP